jgi:hypothetical protein
VIKYEDRADETQEHVEFKIVLDLPKVRERANSFPGRIHDHPGSYHQCSDDPVSMPPRTARLQISVLCMKRPFDDRCKIIIAAAKTENKSGKNPGENEQAYVDDVSGVSHAVE